jgi:hypothetical protein
MIEFDRRQALALTLLLLGPNEALALTSALRGETGERRAEPKERVREVRERPERRDPSERAGGGGRRESLASGAARAESRLRDREKRATGERQKDYLAGGGEKKRDRNATDKARERQDRVIKESTAQHSARTKAAEHNKMTKSVAAERAEKAKGAAKGLKTGVTVAKGARLAATSGALGAAAGKYAAQHAGKAKVLGRASGVLTVAVHAAGTYEIYARNKNAGTPVSVSEAFKQELQRSYVEPVVHARDYVEQQAERGYSAADRGILEWMGQAYGPSAPRW